MSTALVVAAPFQHVPNTSRQRWFWRRVGAHNNPKPAPNVPALVLTIPEACALLRLSKWSLYSKFIHTGKLTTIKVGSRRLVPVSAVYQLIADLGAEGVPYGDKKL